MSNYSNFVYLSILFFIMFLKIILLLYFGNLKELESSTAGLINCRNATAVL